MKKRPSAPRRDRNYEYCWTAGNHARGLGTPIEAVDIIDLPGKFGATRAEDLIQAYRDGWNARDVEIRATQEEVRRRDAGLKEPE